MKVFSRDITRVTFLARAQIELVEEEQSEYESYEELQFDGPQPSLQPSEALRQKESVGASMSESTHGGSDKLMFSEPPPILLEKASDKSEKEDGAEEIEKQIPEQEVKRAQRWASVKEISKNAQNC